MSTDTTAPTGVEAEVIASGVSYFSSTKLFDANGDPLNDAAGNQLVTTKRSEALMGDIITVSQAEYDRLLALDAVQEPGSAKLPRDRDPGATVFSIPLPDGQRWVGPSMGDPRPFGTLADNELHRTTDALTDEERAKLEADARDAVDPAQKEAMAKGNEDAVLVWEDDHTADDVRAFIDANELNVPQTVALADSQEHAELVLEAELSRDNPRAGVVGPLEKQVDAE